MKPLTRLRLQLTAWYAGTFCLILFVLGVLVFTVIARRLAEELDESAHRRHRLERKEHQRELRRAARRAEAEAFDEPFDPEKDEEDLPVHPPAAGNRRRRS